MIVEEGLGDGFTDGLEAGEVDDGVVVGGLEDVLEGVVVEEVDLVEGGGAAGELGAAEDVHGAFLSCYHSALKATELSPGWRGVARRGSFA